LFDLIGFHYFLTHGLCILRAQPIYLEFMTFIESIAGYFYPLELVHLK